MAVIENKSYVASLCHMTEGGLVPSVGDDNKAAEVALEWFFHSTR